MGPDINQINLIKCLGKIKDNFTFTPVLTLKKKKKYFKSHT